jgi:hypothetical protein
MVVQVFSTSTGQSLIATIVLHVHGIVETIAQSQGSGIVVVAIVSNIFIATVTRVLFSFVVRRGG